MDVPKPVGRKSKKTGLPPGTIVHIGEEKTTGVKITVFDYDASNLEEPKVAKIDECFPFKEKPIFSMILIS